MLICNYCEISLFFDISGANPEHLNDLREYIKTMKPVYGRISLPQVIHHMRSRTDFEEKFIGIRGRGIHKTDIEGNHMALKSKCNNKNYYFELYPPIQICIFNKSSLYGYEYHIVFPEQYIKEPIIDFTGTTI